MKYADTIQNRNIPCISKRYADIIIIVWMQMLLYVLDIDMRTYLMTTTIYIYNIN